jgi:hypothetical protein
MKQRSIYVQLIESYISFLKSLSPEEIKKLENNEINIRFEKSPVLKRNNFHKGMPELPLQNSMDINSIVTALFKIHNREEGERYLLSKCSSKIELERVAKKLDIPFQKKDSMQKLKNKIIERTIGFRLRSQAIQGERKGEM